MCVKRAMVITTQPIHAGQKCTTRQRFGCGPNDKMLVQLFNKDCCAECAKDTRCTHSRSFDAPLEGTTYHVCQLYSKCNPTPVSVDGMSLVFVGTSIDCC